MTSRKDSGFTLIEILITVAILGIILSIAVPSYGDYVKRAKVAEAIVITQEARAALVANHIKRREFVKNFGGDTSRRNISIGLQPTDAYKTDTVLDMWVGNGGLGTGNPSAHIAVVLDHGAGVGRMWGSGGVLLLSTIEYVNGEYKFVCGNTAVPWPT